MAPALRAPISTPARTRRGWQRRISRRPPRSDPARQNPGFHCRGIQSMTRKGQQLLPADDLRDIPGIDRLLTTSFPSRTGHFPSNFTRIHLNASCRIPCPPLGKDALITQLAKKMKTISILLLLIAVAAHTVVAEETKRDYGFKDIENLKLDGYEFKFTKTRPGDKDGYLWG